MPRKTVSKETRKAIREAKKMLQEVARMDGNEAETRMWVERIFESVMGYNALKHLSRERAVRTSGLREYVDFTIQMEPGSDARVEVIVELKRVGVDLALKHVRQAASYAIDYGCEWVLLTNGREWRLYHVEFGQPPETKLIEQWNLVTDDVAELAGKFSLISLKGVKKGGLKTLWHRAKVLSPASLLSALASDESLKVLRRTFKKTEGVNVAYEDIVSGLKKLLNEAAAKEMANVRVCIPQRKKRAKKQPTAWKGADEAPSSEEAPPQ